MAVAAVAVAPEASGEETSATPPAGALGVERAATEWALFECADWTAEAAVRRRRPEGPYFLSKGWRGGHCRSGGEGRPEREALMPGAR